MYRGKTIAPVRRLPCGFRCLGLLLLLLLPLCAHAQRFAVIGDFGLAGPDAARVAALVAEHQPDLILTAGDNNYWDGAAATIDQNVGQYYHAYIHPYVGAYGPGAGTNRFFPTLGNHDWLSLSCAGDVCVGPYFDYFTLPGNERYYDFTWGDVHFFALDSDPAEPHGNDPSSQQATWLRDRLAASQHAWKVVYFHHAPYSSGGHGPTPALQWPFRAWGADLVISGHNHLYERLEVDGLTYVVNGLGGINIYSFNEPAEPGSRVRFNGAFGALIVDADPSALEARFITVDGATVDRFALPVAATPSDAPTAAPRFLGVPVPNPAGASAHVELRPRVAGHVQVRIVDMLGRQRLRAYDATVVGRAPVTITFSTAALPSGLYYVVAQDALGVVGQPLLVVH